MTELDLFGDPVPEPEEEPPVESYGVRLTRRQKALADDGRNPLTGSRGPDGRTCGMCVHRVLVRWHNRSYPKCEQAKATRSAETDVRAWWPACSLFEGGRS